MKVGDKVLIKPDLDEKDDHRGSPGWLDEFTFYRGKEVTIKEICEENGDWFKFEEIPWTWSIRWFEPIAPLAEISDEEFDALINGD